MAAMEKIPRHKIQQAIEALWSAYPGRRPPGGDAWLKALETQNPSDFMAAMMSAHKHHPNYPPTLGEILQLVSLAKRNREAEAARLGYHEQEKQAQTPPQKWDQQKQRRFNEYYRRQGCPKTPQAQAQWVAEATDDFERLARTLTVDSFIRRLHPDDPTPEALGIQRASALEKLVSKRF